MAKMDAVVLANSEYRVQKCAMPQAGPQEVVIRVAYAGVNRIDLLQKQGKYPLPSGKPAIPGLEVSGIIQTIGKRVQGWKPGDKVCALLSENGFAEYVSCPASLLLPVPKSLSLQEAAALPESCATAWINFAWQAKLAEAETVLIHGGAGGVGIMAIQVAKAMGARVFATAGTNEKCALCVKVGAEHAINYREQDFVEAVKNYTDGEGVDIILDSIGGDYFERNIAALRHGGRLCVIAFQRSGKVTANMGPVLLKHLHIMGSTLRSRPIEEKARMITELKTDVWPKIEKLAIKPIIDNVFALKDVEKALKRMDEGLNLGKILLKL